MLALNECGQHTVFEFINMRWFNKILKDECLFRLVNALFGG